MVASCILGHTVSEQEFQVLGHGEFRNIPETKEMFDLMNFS